MSPAKLQALRAQIAAFRARAIELHAKLVELERTDGEVRELRERLIASVVRIESVVRELLEPPERWPRGTEPPR